MIELFVENPKVFTLPRAFQEACLTAFVRKKKAEVEKIKILQVLGKYVRADTKTANQAAKTLRELFDNFVSLTLNVDVKEAREKELEQIAEKLRGVLDGR